MAYPKGQSLLSFGPTERIPESGFIYQAFRGKRYPPFINLDVTRELMETWETSADDILICTHQKVGTHLTKKFVVELLRTAYDYPEGHGIHSGDIGHDTVPWPEVIASQHGTAAMQDFIRKTAGWPRVWYTHCAREDLPVKAIHPKTRFIIVVRDPRAAFISQFHFYKSHPLLGASEDLTMHQLKEHFIKSELYFGGYHEHAISWMNKARSEIAIEQALFLRYEELVEDKLNAARLLARFLAPQKHLSDAELMRVVEATTFNTMKAEIADNPQSFHFNPQVFFRKGQTDEWRDALPADIVEAIDAKSRRLWGDRYQGGPNWKEFPSLASEMSRMQADGATDFAESFPLFVGQILDRDLAALSSEVASTPASDLWRVPAGVNNSVGALTRHLCGNLRHFIGAHLGGIPYTRDIEAEFAGIPIPIEELLDEIALTRQAVATALKQLEPSDLLNEMPAPPPHHAGRSVGYFLIQLVSHFQRHWGQLNYARRVLAG